MPASVLAAAHRHMDRPVVLDTAAPDRFPAALTCTRLVDATVLVARRGRTSRETVAQAAEALREVGGCVVGVVLAVKPGWWSRLSGRARLLGRGRSRAAADPA